MAALSHQKDIGVDELSGFQLPVEVTEEFLERSQEGIPILEMADTMTLPRLEMEVPKLGVPVLSGDTRGEEESRTNGSDAESGSVKFNVTDRSYYILVEPKRDALKNTHYGPEEFGNYIIDQFVERWGNDVGLIGLRASASDGNLDSYVGKDVAHLDDTFTGWIARAEGDTQSVDDQGDSTRIGLEDTDTADADSMPEVDMAGDPIDTKMFNDGIQTLDARYRDPDEVVWLTSPDQVQQYHFDLTEREDMAGVAVLQGDDDVTPFDYTVVGINGWPNSYAMLTNPENLAFGLFEEMEMDQLTSSDKIQEERLHSRNWLEGQFDYQLKEMQAGVLVKNIADPLEAA
ncbi:hypothetical protein C490_03488 [Natronobacterium gregoryi SP2]|uniref:Major capsid protein n=1 Tax=Natronobacterium gregoryi (strain ATCC 43098 / DSM 3393 / CCM 3738 / CIP 104747 / IAM 13177 / JCM 8860 / NBRC 102187 / NCIMB 2189 / SP2) TaxID=797304 RepID=L9YE84_NATGS|nr:hypothetical protein C490_03488 [Natronobacterium gregoryi SP2]